MSCNSSVYYNSDLRMFLLSDNIDNSTSGELCFQLLCLIKQDDQDETEKKGLKRKPIHIYINSHGGTTWDAWMLIDIIRSSKTPIYTYCVGYAMSAGFEIFIAGHKRFVSQHARLMLHSFVWGQPDYTKYQDLVNRRCEEDYLQNSQERYVLEQTKISETMLKEIREKKIDRYFHADEALKLGIAHKLLI